MQRPTSGTLMLCVVLVAAVVSTRWVRVNISFSVPVGLYHLVAVPTPIARGMLVLVPVPASVQGVWSRWLPLLKPVVAIAGDTVCAFDDTLWVEGVSYGPVLATHHGQPLPHLSDCLTVPEGHVFVASPVPKSLDSRYFGCVALPTVLARAIPVFTWR